MTFKLKIILNNNTSIWRFFQQSLFSNVKISCNFLLYIDIGTKKSAKHLHVLMIYKGQINLKIAMKKVIISCMKEDDYEN